MNPQNNIQRSVSEAYQLGWHTGSKQLVRSNPFDVGTCEWTAYEKGFNDEQSGVIDGPMYLGPDMITGCAE